MPLYSYECKKCANKFDVIKKLKDFDKKEKCPKCESTYTKRYISKANDFILVGDDWVKNGGEY